jgi:hypothetical protein
MVLPRIFLAAAFLPLVLTGCGSDDISRTFGMSRDSPDEFTVTTRAPLSMPPNYALRPPRPGEARPQELSERQEAEAVLAPQAALANDQSGNTSPGQEALLAAAGPAAPANIRRRVDSDAAIEQTDRGFTDRLMFWHTPQDKAEVVDPQREAQRLRQNSALGQSPTAGDTPIIQHPTQTWWQRIF